MNPFLRTFAHLAIRLLIAIYRELVITSPRDPGLDADAQAWLDEHNKP